MKKAIDLTGLVFGRITVIRLKRIMPRRDREWICHCSCGASIDVPGERLRNGQTTSCGCYREEIRGSYRRIHGMADTKPHNNWMNMLSRCENRKNKSFARYGGRGIKVCRRWHRFDAFWKDMGVGYEPGLTIDRIDNDGNYEPGNCRWATPKQQARNRRSNRILECRGKRMTVIEWSENVGATPGLIRSRLSKGWNAETAIFRPHRLTGKST